jgi:hypothetical protein
MTAALVHATWAPVPPSDGYCLWRYERERRSINSAVGVSGRMQLFAGYATLANGP